MSKQKRKAAIEGALLQKWRGWLESTNGEVARAMSRSRQWNELAKKFEQNPSIQVAQEFYPWVRKMYWDSTALFVRQQAHDDEPRSISLIRLLRCMAEQPHIVSRGRVLGEHSLSPGISTSETDPAMKRHMEEMLSRSLTQKANEQIDKWAGRGGDQIRPAFVLRDIAKLKQVAGPALLFARKQVAHKEAKGISKKISGRDIDRAVSLIRRLAIKYSDILCVPCGLRQHSTRQFNYEEIFRRPWIPPTWKRVRRGPAYFMERRSELWPSPDRLALGEYQRVKRRKKQILEELGDRHHRWHGPSPVRDWLDANSLPSSDAAALLVRDIIAQAPRE